MTDLFEVTRGQFTPGSDKPRSATHAERNAYLRWLAERRGVTIPDGAEFQDGGIWDREAKAYLLKMPGYGVAIMVDMETTDESGNVIRRVTMATDNKGAIPLKAKRVHDETGLTPQRAKKAPRRDIAELRAELGRPAPVCVTSPAVEPIDWQAVEEWDAIYQAPEPCEAPVTSASAPVPPPVDELAALRRIVAELSSRMAALEQGKASPPAPAIEADAPGRAERSPAHLRAIRSYLAMRAARNTARAERDTAKAARSEALVHASRVYGVEEALIGARSRGDRLLRLAMRQRDAIGQSRIDGRGYRAEIGALRRQLTVAQTPRVVPPSQPGTMAVAFHTLSSRVAAQMGA